MILRWSAYAVGMFLILGGRAAFADGPSPVSKLPPSAEAAEAFFARQYAFLDAVFSKSPPCADCPAPPRATPAPGTPSPARPGGTGTQPGGTGTQPGGTGTQPGGTGQTPTSPSSTDSSTNTSDTNTASAPEAGVEGGASFAPNMFGDQFGPTNSVTMPVNQNFRGVPSSVMFSASSTTNPTGVVTFSALQAYTTLNTTFPAGTMFTSLGSVRTNPPIGPGPSTPTASTIAVAPQAQEAAAAQRYAAATFGPGGTLTYLQNQSNATFVGTTPSLLSTYILDTEYNYFIPGATIPGTIVNIPNPSNGGAVGRTKISDGNNPLPRDRVFCDYDYFDSVPLTARGAPVHRFSPGFETTFLQQSASLEVRLPFAATISNTITTDGMAGDRLALGNMHLTLKGLVYNTSSLHISTGLGIDLPTADDVHVALPDGTEVLRIRNEAVILTPYVGALFTPNNRLFAQAWVQFGFDANGNPVDGNPNGTGMQQVGRLNDMTLAQLDSQIGYWVYQSEQSSSTLQRLAPFLELHYNSTLGATDIVNAGGIGVGDLTHLDELNLGFGLISYFRNNLNLNFGVVLPLKNLPDRTFNYQIGLHGNIFFGPSARNPAAAVSSF